MNSSRNWFSNLWDQIFKGDSDKPSDTDNPVFTGGAMNKKAICVGINAYPYPNTLHGCIKDCNDWSMVLSSKFNFQIISIIKDQQATRENIISQLSTLIKTSVPGDILVFTYSGHGSYVVDTSSPKPDHKEETIYTIDGNLFDYEFRTLFNSIPDGVSMTVILDSCFSGTATRLDRHGNIAKTRFMPPSDPAMAAFEHLPTAKRAFIPESQMKEILLSGASSNEQSYDADFGGIPNGALTYFAIQTLKTGISNGATLTFKQWYDMIRQSLPSHQYPQTPQLEGSDTNKSKPVFS